ncbi:MAG: hypothetical protein OXB94_07325, partial [Nitrospira sp.]|nr:hypothetical protein [Nitrospira sp.]
PDYKRRGRIQGLWFFLGPQEQRRWILAPVLSPSTALPSTSGALSLTLRTGVTEWSRRMRKDDRKGKGVRDYGAAAPAGAGTWRHQMARLQVPKIATLDPR